MSESMRGSRLGTQSLESDRGAILEPRVSAEYICSNGHRSVMYFATDVALPDSWDCRSCPSPAVRQFGGKPVELEISVNEGKRSHFDMVLERRTREELEELLTERLELIRDRRRQGKADL